MAKLATKDDTAIYFVAVNKGNEPMTLSERYIYVTLQYTKTTDT